MCGIVGFTNKGNLFENEEYVIRQMTDKVSHRGENAEGYYSANSTYLGHKRLSIRDITGGAQPMSFSDESGNKYTIVYNGEIYNTDELKGILSNEKVILTTTCDTEIILKLYIMYKEKCLELIKGIFSFCVYSEAEDILFLARDPLGVKPLFYTVIGKDIIFASEMKAILCLDAFPKVIDKEGICQLLGTGPVLPIGKCVFKGMKEVMPGNYLIFKDGNITTVRYFKLRSYEHTDNLETTIAKVRKLLTNSINSQLVSDVPIGSLLSGGLDSSIITGISALSLKAKGETDNLKTFSVDYEDSEVNFKKTDFTPDRDNKYIDIMRDKYNLNHKYIVIDNNSLYEALYDAMIARDLPSMADIDSSLYLFFKYVKKDVTVALSGEFSDEIFCGYPWFYREDTINASTFPWSISLDLREQLLNDDLKKDINLKEYVDNEYAQAVEDVPLDYTTSDKDILMKKYSYLTMQHFGLNLLIRTDRMSMASSLEVRVPFTDIDLVEYVYNIPWEMKNYGNMEKGILREAFKDVLPNEIVFRKKSPYPKTYNEKYTTLVEDMLRKIVENKDNKIQSILNIDFIKNEILNKTNEEFTRPWFGQLMLRPQLMAYIIQMEMWFREYNVEIEK